MAIFTTSREKVIISTGFQKVRSWRKFPRRAEQPMKVPAITWAIFFAALGMCLRGTRQSAPLTR